MLDIKSAVMSNLERHFSNDARQRFLRLASVLDPRHKALEFLILQMSLPLLVAEGLLTPTYQYAILMRNTSIFSFRIQHD